MNLQTLLDRSVAEVQTRVWSQHKSVWDLWWTKRQCTGSFDSYTSLVSEKKALEAWHLAGSQEQWKQKYSYFLHVVGLFVCTLFSLVSSPTKFGSVKGYQNSLLLMFKRKKGDILCLWAVICVHSTLLHSLVKNTLLIRSVRPKTSFLLCRSPSDVNTRNANASL